MSVVKLKSFTLHPLNTRVSCLESEVPPSTTSKSEPSTSVLLILTSIAKDGTVLLEYNNLVTPLVKAPLLALSGLPSVLSSLNLTNLTTVAAACEKHKASSNQIYVRDE